MVGLADKVLEISGDTEINPADNRTYLAQATLSGYAALLLQRGYARCFAGMSEAHIDRVLQSFAFKNCRVHADGLPDTSRQQEHYTDPLALDPDGGRYDRLWLARMEPVSVRGHDTGWIVIVQEAYDAAIGDTLARLKHGLVTSGLIAMGLIALVMAGLWGMAKRLSASR